MTIQLSSVVERQILELAMRQRRAVEGLVEDALRQYLEAESITDVGSAELAEVEVALLGELSGNLNDALKVF